MYSIKSAAHKKVKEKCKGNFKSSKVCPKCEIFGGFKKKFLKVTRTKEILCMLPKYIIIHGFRPFGQKMP